MFQILHGYCFLDCTFTLYFLVHVYPGKEIISVVVHILLKICINFVVPETFVHSRQLLSIFYSRLSTFYSRLFTLDSRRLLSTFDIYSRLSIFTLDSRLLDTLDWIYYGHAGITICNNEVVRIPISSSIFTIRLG